MIFFDQLLHRLCGVICFYVVNVEFYGRLNGVAVVVVVQGVGPDSIDLYGHNNAVADGGAVGDCAGFY